MFNRARLLREYPWDAQSLAEELYAMFDPEIPLNHEGPLQLTARNGVAPLIINNLPIGTDPIIQNPPTQQIPDEPGQPNIEEEGEGEPQTPATPSPGGGGGGANCFPGKVTSGGPGTSYLVDVYLDGLSQPATNVSARQLAIDGLDTVAADTWCLVAKQNDGQYVFQVPTWAL